VQPIAYESKQHVSPVEVELIHHPSQIEVVPYGNHEIHGVHRGTGGCHAISHRIPGRAVQRIPIEVTDHFSSG